MSHQVLPSDRWPLFEVRVTRVATEDWRLHFSIDALILDGESNNLLLRRNLRPLPRPTASSASLGADVPRLRAACARSRPPRMDRPALYWEARLDTLPPGPALPLAVDPSRLADPRFCRLTPGLAPEVWNRLKARAAAGRADAVQRALHRLRRSPGHVGALRRLHPEPHRGRSPPAAPRRRGDARRVHQPDSA